VTYDDIQRFMHCTKCLEELPRGQSPKEWSRTQTGITRDSIVVWCARHDELVVEFEFEEPIEDMPACGECN